MARFSDQRSWITGGSRLTLEPDVLLSWAQTNGLNLEPDFQRPVVWDQERQSSYVEFLFRGGESAREIYLNDPAFGSTPAPHCDLPAGLMVVDGKQRLTAVTRFMKGEIPAFGHYLSDFSDRSDVRRAMRRAGLTFVVQELQTRSEVLQWYLDLNTGGMAHSEAEIERVRQLLNQTKSQPAAPMGIDLPDLSSP